MRKSGFKQDFRKFSRDGRRFARRFEDHCVADHESGYRHAHHDGEGEIPRRNDNAHAERKIYYLIAFARELNNRLRVGKLHGLAGVVLAKIDGLGDIALGLGPGLAGFVDKPSIELVLALAKDLGSAEQAPGALVHGNFRPCGEVGERSFDRVARVLLRAFLVNAHNFGRPGRVY